jgi:CspA family cold shock protein
LTLAERSESTPKIASKPDSVIRRARIGSIAAVVMLPCGRPLLELTVRLKLSFEKIVEVTVTTGTIKKVVSERGFGFISGEDGKEYFFHRDGLTSSLNFDRLAGGEKVEFEIEQSPKGARAKNVTAA